MTKKEGTKKEAAKKEGMKKEGKRKPLVSRLRNVIAHVAASKAQAETQAEAKAEILESSQAKTPLRNSVLTPSQSLKPLSKKTKTFTIFLSAETESQLHGVLSSASPFSGPLTMTNLIDLMYCELVKSPELKDRAKSYIKDMEMPSQDKKTSLILKTGIDRFFQKSFGLSSVKALTKLLQWIVSDWPWIRPRLTYKGLQENDQSPE